jgi:sporulation protein YlmC with PRC-barrel domain
LRPRRLRTANQIYLNMLVSYRTLRMSKSEMKYKQAQHFVGMQVIDTKGTVVGNVKDVSVDFQSKSLAFRVTTKNRSELDMNWDDVQSVEDVVLLKKEVDLTSMSETQASPSTNESQVTVQAVLLCSNCGTSAPGHAKFCPKCGTALR